MAALTTNVLSSSLGTKPTFVAASTSDTAEVGDKHFVVYKNTDASAKTLTVVVPGNTEYGIAMPDIGTASNLIATTGELWFPLREEYADSTGRATITLSPNATGCTVSVVRVD